MSGNKMIAVAYEPKDVTLVVNGTEVLNPGKRCDCGKDSDFGCHGVRNGDLYSEYFCKSCYNRRKV